MEKPRRIGPYVILREIGRGGMATVYEARLLSGDDHVVLKVARGDQSDFLKEEAESLANLVTILDHPNILKILPLPLGKGEKDYYIARDPKTNDWYIALEYANGGSLRDKLNREKRIGIREAIEIISQVGSALDYAHSRGIIHRDIKPTNILFKRLPSGETKVLLSDFGIAKVRSIEGVKGIIGTPGYMSFEQASGKDVDHRSDIYSLGVVLYEMLTGRAPFERIMFDTVYRYIHQPPPPPSGINPLIPKEVETVIMKTLAKNPEDRFQSVKEMVSVLKAAVKASDLEAKYGMSFEEFTAYLRNRATMKEEIDWEEWDDAKMILRSERRSER